MANLQSEMTGFKNFGVAEMDADLAESGLQGNMRTMGGIAELLSYLTTVPFPRKERFSGILDGTAAYEFQGGGNEMTRLSSFAERQARAA